MTQKKADISTKRLISLAPDRWIQWLMGRSGLKALQIISSEFQWVARESDVLVKAYSPDLGEFLILNELQLRYNQKVPRRMRAYTAMASEKYQLPVYAVLINLLEASSGTIASSFESNFAGQRAIQEYQVINLWEIDVDIVFQRNLSTLLPLVPILFLRWRRTSYPTCFETVTGSRTTRGARINVRVLCYLRLRSRFSSTNSEVRYGNFRTISFVSRDSFQE